LQKGLGRLIGKGHRFFPYNQEIHNGDFG
jgi:hypothetical protein